MRQGLKACVCAVSRHVSALEREWLLLLLLVSDEWPPIQRLKMHGYISQHLQTPTESGDGVLMTVITHGNGAATCGLQPPKCRAGTVIQNLVGPSVSVTFEARLGQVVGCECSDDNFTGHDIRAESQSGTSV